MCGLDPETPLDAVLWRKWLEALARVAADKDKAARGDSNSHSSGIGAGQDVAGQTINLLEDADTDEAIPEGAVTAVTHSASSSLQAVVNVNDMIAYQKQVAKHHEEIRRALIGVAQQRLNSIHLKIKVIKETAAMLDLINQEATSAANAISKEQARTLKQLDSVNACLAVQRQDGGLAYSLPRVVQGLEHASASLTKAWRKTTAGNGLLMQTQDRRVLETLQEAREPVQARRLVDGLKEISS